MIRKLMITPWFGAEPEWMMTYWANVQKQLEPQGYDFLMWDDLSWFEERVWNTLGIDCPITYGSSKIHDYRAAFGVIFAEEIESYEFWGHTDFDCVYGCVGEWVTDEFLDGLDIHSNHVDYMCGPWSLYRNTPTVNELFRRHPNWQSILQDPTTLGWVEMGFTEIVDAAHEAGEIRRTYTMWQTKNLDDFSALSWDTEVGCLVEGNREVMMAHFRRTKTYPEGCR